MTLILPPRLREIADAEYPRYSSDEVSRRRRAVEILLEAADADHLIYCGANRFGSAVQWLTQWPVTAEAVGVFSPRSTPARTKPLDSSRRVDWQNREHRPV